MNSELLDYIIFNKYILSHKDVVSGQGSKLHKLGLDNILICYVGRGRSPAVAELLCELDIPAIALEGGTRKIEELGNDELLRIKLQEFTRISCILDWAEKREFTNKLGLNIYRYFDHPDLAFHTIRNLK